MINFGATGYAVNSQGAQTLLRLNAQKDPLQKPSFQELQVLIAKNPNYQIPTDEGRLFIREDLLTAKANRQTGRKAYLYQTPSNFSDEIPEGYVLFETYKKGRFQKVNLTG